MQLPSTFCWTKMQAEAGQSLEAIVARKELERISNGGLFFWGIGNTLGERLYHWRATVDVPLIAFSPMRSAARDEDRTPAAVCVWLAYSDRFGRRHRLPEATLVTSRATTASGPKRRHYALVCRTSTTLELRSRAQIALGIYRNFGSASPRIGGSQVTTILQQARTEASGPVYDVAMIAELESPYAVRLQEPVTLYPEERSYLDELTRNWTSPESWQNALGQLRLEWEYRLKQGALEPLSNANCLA